MKVSPEILNRKGARKLSEIPAEVLELLNQGVMETKNLVEWLAVDPMTLLEKTLDKPRRAWFPALKAAILAEPKPTQMKLTRVLGKTFWEQAQQHQEIETTENWLMTHGSDIIRSWACFYIGSQPLDLAGKLAKIRTLAADLNAGVREVAFMAVKADIADHLDEAIALLTSWIEETDENLRRFAVEATRPIGVWTNKIQILKEQPEKGLPLLAPLKADPSKYVQNAVANWLNDASKTRPDWVQAVCDDWLASSDTKATQYIVKRALRTINKA